MHRVELVSVRRNQGKVCEYLVELTPRLRTQLWSYVSLHVRYDVTGAIRYTRVLMPFSDVLGAEKALRFVQSLLHNNTAKCLSTIIFITLKVVCENILMSLLCGLAAAVIS